MPRVADELREDPTVSLASSTPHGGRRKARPSPLSPAAWGGGVRRSSMLDLTLELSVLVHGGPYRHEAGKAWRWPQGCGLRQQQRPAGSCGRRWASFLSLRRRAQDK
ncbi:unnamed protein product [Urochloa humidicola]